MVRRGQVAVYLVLVIAALCMLALMNADVFLVVRSKNRVQNAGDAAAVAAAREQGSLLNLMGRLNVEHVVAAARDDRERCDEIVTEQLRLALLGPLEALRRANAAAKDNGMEARDEFSEILRRHVQDVRTVYSGGVNADGEPYPEPWEGAWGEYALEIESAMSGGLAVGPDNCEFYDAQGGHLLLERNFYFAVSGRNWCWFHFNAESVLRGYSGFGSWSPLPRRDESRIGDCEIFPLHVEPRAAALADVFTPEEILHLVSTYSDERLSAEDLAASSILTNAAEKWFFLDAAAWRPWNEIKPVASGDSGTFPVVGEVKPEYDVRGCAAICRCLNETPSVMAEGRSSDVSWVAAAKPFGTVTTPEGETAPANALHSFLVPCFSAVRLVPVDSVGGEDLATADYGWVMHVRDHLPQYLATGPIPGNGCFWCEQLVSWENPVLREVGMRWIDAHGSTCVRGGPGHGSRGGTSHGH